MEQIREKMQEIYDKLQNGDTETKFMIGNQEFSIKEWDSFLEKFDSVQDAIREALEEKIEKQTEEHFEEEDLEETVDKKPDVNQDFPIFPRRLSVNFFEQVLKIVAVVEAVFQSNIRDGTVGGKKRRLGVFEPYIV